MYLANDSIGELNQSTIKASPLGFPTLLPSLDIVSNTDQDIAGARIKESPVLVPGDRAGNTARLGTLPRLPLASVTLRAEQ